MTKEIRPWGEFEFLEGRIVMKRITVNPGHRLSLQSHAKRDEYWIWESGKGGYFNMGTDSGYSFGPERRVRIIPAGTKHRVGCHEDATEPLVFVEFQVGEPDEEDIIRYDDDYGR